MEKTEVASDMQTFTNWIDPDILALDEGKTVSYDLDKEHEFKLFFEVEWQQSVFDSLRERWGWLIAHEDPYVRRDAKTALWAVLQLRSFRKMQD